MRASAYSFYFIRKERARTETIFGFQFIAINSSAHTSTLILCVYMWWLTKPISTLFHVNMKFFGILITFQTKIVKHAKPKRRREKKNIWRKTIQQLFVFCDMEQQLQERLPLISFSTTQKRTLFETKENVKLYQMASRWG